MNKFKNRSGISLISLIGIIVILLILAGLILRMVLGPNGLVSKGEKDKYRRAGIELRKVLITELNNRNKIRNNENINDKEPMFKSPQEIINIFNKKAEDLNEKIIDIKFYEISEKSKDEIKKYEEENKQNLYLEKGNEISKTNEFSEEIKKGEKAFIIRVVSSLKESNEEGKYNNIFELTFKPDEFISMNSDLEVVDKKTFEKENKESKKEEKSKDKVEEKKEENKKNKEIKKEEKTEKNK